MEKTVVKLVEEALTLCGDDQYQRAFDLARSVLSQPTLMDLDRAYMHVILALDPTESLAKQGEAGFLYFRKLCLELPNVPNAAKFYYDALRVVLKGKRESSEFERGPIPDDFIPIDPRLVDPSFSYTYSSADDGVTTQLSTRSQPFVQIAMAQDSRDAPSVNKQSVTMKEELRFVYTAEERKNITDRARSAVDFIFADDQAAGTMINKAFFPDSLYEKTVNRSKQPQEIASQGVTSAQDNITFQGLPMHHGINTPHEIFKNHEATNFQPNIAPQPVGEVRISKATFHCPNDSQPVSASPVRTEAQEYNAVVHGVNSFQSSNKHGLPIENQLFAVAQAQTELQGGQTSHEFASVQHSLPSRRFAESNELNLDPELIGHYGVSGSQSFFPTYASAETFQLMPSSRSLNGFQALDTTSQHFTGIQTLNRHLAPIGNQLYAVTHEPTASGGMIPTHAGGASQIIAGTHGIPTPNVFTSSQAFSGVNNYLTNSNLSATSQVFTGNQLAGGYHAINAAPQHNEKQPFSGTQPYATKNNSTTAPEATTAHSATAFGNGGVKRHITWTEKRERDVDMAKVRFEVKRRKIVRHFYDGNFRQTSYRDQGPTFGVVLAPTTAETDSKCSESRDMEASDTEIGDEDDGNIETDCTKTSGMETDGHRDW